MVVYAGDTGFGIAVVAADELVDLLEVGKLLGLSYIRLANEGELAEIFSDCEGKLTSAAFGVYPLLLPASTDPALSLTIDNAVAGSYGLHLEQERRQADKVR